MPEAMLLPLRQKQVPEMLQVAESSPIPGGPSQMGGMSPTDECPSPLPASGRASPSAYEQLDAEEDSRLRAFKQGESLGKGAYGEVFKAMVAGRFMAVKKIPLDLTLNQKAAQKEIDMLLLEINTLKRLKHERIVRYHGCIRQDSEEDPALLIFLEYMPSGSIKGVLDKFGPYGVGLVRKYTRQILEGLHFLHEHKIVHRDVKGANILIDAQGDAKLADFGACKELEALQNTVTGGIDAVITGSLFWMAPEVVKLKAGRRSDIWSLGCTVIEMITAEVPWPHLREKKVPVTELLRMVSELREIEKYLPKKLTSDCDSFLRKTLNPDATRRPYASALLTHRFVCQEAVQSPPSRASAGEVKILVMEEPARSHS